MGGVEVWECVLCGFIGYGGVWECVFSGFIGYVGFVNRVWGFCGCNGGYFIGVVVVGSLWWDGCMLIIWFCGLEQSF